MQALRIMSFNVQLLPSIVNSANGVSNRPEEIANTVADAILALPLAELPDVIAFNEVFNEDGRDQLMKRLRPGWPEVIEKLWDGLLEEDAGLMLFSRFAFLPLATGGNRLERFYGDSAGFDSLSSKGVGIVQIATPVRPTTIAFTHLQASYDTEDQHSEVRAKQLNAVFAALEEILAVDGGHRGSVIILGDLNIRGDSGAVLGEWAALFEQGGTQLFNANLDGWKSYMHPPGLPGFDEGHTNITFDDAGKRQRLDYMCFAKPGFADILLVPQHMRIRLRNSSDHFALEAVVQLISPHCTPSTAIDALDVVSNVGGQPGLPTSVRQIEVAVLHEGSYQWLYIHTPGTYTVHKSPQLITECYLQSDLSHAITRLDTLDLRTLPPSLQPGFRHARIDPRGDTFVSREPFFVLVKAIGANTGAGTIWLTEHKGESDVTAIALQLHGSAASSFPAGQRLGADDVCWFRTVMPSTYAGAARSERFIVRNPTGGPVTANILGAAKQELVLPVSGAAATLEVQADFSGGEQMFLTLHRTSDTQTGFEVIWESPVCYVDLDDPFFLYVADESGAGFFGSDEPEMQINFDSSPVPVFAGSWDDADTGERWPGLRDAILVRVAAVLPGATRVGFVESITISYVDPDFNAQGWMTQFIHPLAADEPHRTVRTVALPVPDVTSDGLYTMTCTLTRFP